MNTERAVLITGTSTGIGRACALHLDAHNFRVFACVRKIADAESLQAAASSRLTTVLLDVTDSASISAAVVQVTKSTEQGLYALVNNAGLVVQGPLEYVPIEQSRRLLEVNVIGVLAVTQAFLPLLRQGQGRIVNIGSESGVLALPGVSIYAASKFALEAITDALRIELKTSGISVSIVEPGNIETPLWEKANESNFAGVNDMHYAPLIAFISKLIRNPHGIPAAEVAKVVENILTAKKPPRRMLVGLDAYILKSLSKLPCSIRDFILTHIYLRFGIQFLSMGARLRQIIKG